MTFDTVVVVDWSARSAPSPAKPTKDAIFVATAHDGTVTTAYHRTRSHAIAALTSLFAEALTHRRRVLAGFDFPFGYPRGFARVVSGSDDPLHLWAALARRIVDDDRNANNRFDVAEELNGLLPGVGPFWGCPTNRATDRLPAKGTLRVGHGMPERRKVEHLIRRAQPCWKLFTTGSVGSQALLGIARLHGLRQRFGDALSVAPFQAPTAPIVLTEIYPALLDAEVRAQQRAGEIMDAAQVRVLAQAFAGLPGERLMTMLAEGDREEGWITGLGHAAELVAASRRFLRPAPTA